MIVVRDTFIAKPGMASKLAKMFKEEEWGGEIRVVTDLIGQYNTVEMESTYESLGAWEAEMKKWMEMPKKEKPDPTKPKHTDMYQTGKREIFRIW